mmetsp:Transcript_25494/g.22497  ORF Transcript_25494/g.22497 Transcript_25494/m.22497 type:complete len:148 (-) Transcript_25494:70-513(-)
MVAGKESNFGSHAVKLGRVTDVLPVNSEEEEDSETNTEGEEALEEEDGDDAAPNQKNSASKPTKSNSKSLAVSSEENENGGFKLKNVGSGVAIEENIMFGLIDKYDSIARYDSSSTLEILSEDGKISSSLASIKAVNGIFNLKGVVL